MTFHKGQWGLDGDCIFEFMHVTVLRLLRFEGEKEGVTTYSNSICILFYRTWAQSWTWSDNAPSIAFCWALVLQSG